MHLFLKKLALEKQFAKKKKVILCSTDPHQHNRFDISFDEVIDESEILLYDAPPTATAPMETVPTPTFQRCVFGRASTLGYPSILPRVYFMRPYFAYRQKKN